MEKIRKNREFSRVYNKGKKLSGRYIIVFENENKIKRFGVVASKKVGNSVYRSRAKRVIREAIRLNEDLFKNNAEYVIVAKSIFKDKIDEIKMQDIQKDIFKIFKRNKNEKCFNKAN